MAKIEIENPGKLEQILERIKSYQNQKNKYGLKIPKSLLDSQSQKSQDLSNIPKLEPDLELVSSILEEEEPEEVVPEQPEVEEVPEVKEVPIITPQNYTLEQLTAVQDNDAIANN